MRLSFAGSTGWFGSTHSSRLPLPLVSRTSGVQPCDRALVAGLFEHLAVEPADDLVARVAARPQRLVRVFGEHEVVRLEARADQREVGPVFGSYIERCRFERSTGNAFADG